jgi:hypothetical protein
LVKNLVDIVCIKDCIILNSQIYIPNLYMKYLNESFGVCSAVYPRGVLRLETA